MNFDRFWNTILQQLKGAQKKQQLKLLNISKHFISKIAWLSWNLIKAFRNLKLRV
jgi:hypothetical protein